MAKPRDPIGPEGLVGRRLRWNGNNGWSPGEGEIAAVAPSNGRFRALVRTDDGDWLNVAFESGVEVVPRWEAARNELLRLAEEDVRAAKEPL